MNKDIRENKNEKTVLELSKIYKVQSGYIKQIINNKIWKHIKSLE